MIIKHFPIHKHNSLSNIFVCILKNLIQILHSDYVLYRTNYEISNAKNNFNQLFLIMFLSYLKRQCIQSNMIFLYFDYIFSPKI